ncbi:unnamed protein product [Closterium sp. NIES-53]
MENLMYKDWKAENEAKIGMRFGEVKSSGLEHVELPLELSSGSTTTRQSSLVNGGDEAKDAEEEEEEVQQVSERAPTLPFRTTSAPRIRVTPQQRQGLHVPAAEEEGRDKRRIQAPNRLTYDALGKPAKSALAGAALIVGDDEESDYDECAFVLFSPVEMPREPATLKEALESSDAEEWKKAMESELKSIEENGTWELVELPKGRKAITSKWLFKIKSDADGKIERYKSRLVAKGYQQKERVDYKELFAPVVKPTTLRTLLAGAAIKGWVVKQMDVTTAFLNGVLEEEIFVAQPEGFDDGSGRVLKLKKALYGLKQDPRQWYLKLRGVLEEIGFTPSTADHSLFMLGEGEQRSFMVVYVDDILIFSPSSDLVKEVMLKLQDKFKPQAPRRLGLSVPAATAAATAATAAATAAPACCTAMASLKVLAFDHEGRPVQFDTWLDDLQLYLLSDSKDSVSLFDLTSCAAPAPPATADTQALYDAVVARYSSPAIAALGRLLLPYLFPELSAFTMVEDLVSHLRSSDASYRTTVPAEFLDKNQPPMFIMSESSLPEVPDPEFDRTRAASPTVSHLLASAVTDPSFESGGASALVGKLLDFAAACRLDYANALVAESMSATPPSIGGECALGTDVLEDRQEDFECLATAVPRFASMLLAPEGDLDAPDIPTPRSYAEAIRGPYSSQWQAAVDAEMASWKSTGTYARYVARGFSQRQGVDYFQTFSPTPKMTTLRVLLLVAAQRDYELHSLDFSTAFLQGSVHEEIWLRRPPGFTGSFPTGTQWSLQRPVYGLRQAPHEWHDTLRTTLAALGFAPVKTYMLTLF